MKKLLTLALVFAFVICLTGFAWGDETERKLQVKNIIIMISDGCGYNHVDAASLYQYGRTGTQIYEKFPVKYAMATYPGPIANSPIDIDDKTASWGSYDPSAAWSAFDNVKNNATDSAAAATAMSTGHKTYNSAIGIDAHGKPLVHCSQRAEEKGMSTGVVTTVFWSHATPAGFMAHNQNRNDYENIAREMVYKGSAEVIIGAGHPWFDNDSKIVSNPNTFKYVGGEKTWNELAEGIAGGDCDGDNTPDPWTLIQKREEFTELISGNTPKRILGTFACHSTAQQARSGDAQADPFVIPLNKNVPTLAETTMAAINVLDNNRNGFFLMVEGGAIDKAGHSNQSGRVIEEEIDFNRAVEAVCSWVEKNSNWNETLLIVTGDHETGYLNGPGSNPDWKPLVNNGKGVTPGMEWHSGGHTNSLVPFFAKGKAGLLFEKHVDGTDPVRGSYIDNTSVGRVVFEVLD